MQPYTNTRRYTIVLTLLLMFANAVAQVTPVEPATNVSRQNTRNTISPAEKVPAEAEDAAGATMGVMNAQGYFALFTQVRREAQAKNRYRAPQQHQKQLDQVVEKLGELYPNSFEYHYASYLNDRFDTAAGNHLLEAHRLAPLRTDLFDDLASHYELKGDQRKKLEYCRLLENNKVYDPAIYQYAQNLLASVEQGGILFTQGEWDTHPLWVLQHNRRFRTDVTILQLELLHQEQYFNRMTEPLKLKKGAFQRFVNDKPAFFREVAATKTTRGTYLSLTIDQQLIGALGNLLYTTGLAMKLSAKPFDNITILQANWKNFDLSLLTTRSANSDLNKLNGNYILPMGVMYRHAKESGNTTETEKLKQQMMAVAGNAGKKKEVEGLF
jgi:hypothetical protein